MAPARVEEDPVTAEYDIFLTPSQQSQLYLLQYLNREPHKPYNARAGARPQEMRIKPKSGYLEMDVKLSTEHNYNKWQGLRWGDAMRASQELQQGGQTFGMAAGFQAARPGSAAGKKTVVKGREERELELQNDLANFENAELEGKAMASQTLGGQIVRHDSVEEVGKPVYFVGAFRGSELHLTSVTGTIQMRPQFHHIDAEAQRNRLADSREQASATDTKEPPEKSRLVHQTYKATTANPKGDLEIREASMRDALRSATEEEWVPLEYVDEDDEDAYTAWNQRMFVEDTSETKCARLKSAMSDEQYLDAISAPGRQGLGRRRKRSKSKAEMVDLEDEESEQEGEEAG